MAKSAKGEIGPDVRRKHLELWQRSGQTMVVYCREAGIAKNQLAYWQKTVGKKAGAGSAFARVRAAAVPASAPSGRLAARLTTRDGACLEIDGAADPVWAARVIAAVGGHA